MGIGVKNRFGVWVMVGRMDRGGNEKVGIFVALANGLKNKVSNNKRKSNFHTCEELVIEKSV